MNIHRGVFRIWVVLTLLWAAVILVPETLGRINSPQPVTDPALLARLNEVDDWVAPSTDRSGIKWDDLPSRAAPSKSPFDPSKPFEVVYRTEPKGLWELLALVTGPPISIVMVWFVMVWVLRGFKPKIT